MYVIQDMVSSTVYTCFGDPRVADNIDALNYAVVQCTHEFAGDDLVKVLNRTSSGDVELLYGYVKKCTTTTKGQYEIEVSEMAYELVKLKVGTGPDYIVNTAGSVDDVIDDILTGTGWTRQSTAADTIPNNQLRNIDAFSAIKKVLTELSPTRYYFWFDSANKYVYFGEYRNDRSATNFDATRDKITKNVYRDTNKMNYAAVKVLANDTTIYAISPTSYTGQDCIVLQMLSATTEAMCQAIADRLYADKYGDEYKRITVAGAPSLMVVGANTILEGDKVQVDTVTYIVTDVITKPGKITWGLNRAERSMWDLVGTDIIEVSGTATAAANGTWSGGNMQVGAAAAGKWNLNIADVTKIDDFVLSMKLKKLVRPSSDQAAYLGLVDTGDKGTGLSTSNAASAGITVNNSNEPAGQSLASVGIYSTITISSYTAWEYVNEDSLTLNNFGTSGRHFGVMVANIGVYATATTIAVFRIVDGNGTAYGSDVTVKIPIKGITDERYSIAIMMTMPYKETEGTADTTFYLKCMLYNSSQTAFDITWANIMVWKVSRHSHANTDPTHSNSITDLDHYHGNTDQSQTHSANNAVIEVTSYPSNIVVKVNGTTVKTDAGGSEKVVDCGDITTYLVNGANAIEMTTDASGNAEATGTYVGYG
jgi:hypothetical protein